jgi:hypothetical protein
VCGFDPAHDDQWIVIVVPAKNADKPFFMMVPGTLPMKALMAYNGIREN